MPLPAAPAPCQPGAPCPPGAQRGFPPATPPWLDDRLNLGPRRFTTPWNYTKSHSTYVINAQHYPILPTQGFPRTFSSGLPGFNMNLPVATGTPADCGQPPRPCPAPAVHGPAAWRGPGRVHQM